MVQIQIRCDVAHWHHTVVAADTGCQDNAAQVVDLHSHTDSAVDTDPPTAAGTGSCLAACDPSQMMSPEHLLTLLCVGRRGLSRRLRSQTAIVFYFSVKIKGVSQEIVSARPGRLAGK